MNTLWSGLTLAALFALPVAVAPSSALAATEHEEAAPAQFEVDAELREGDEAAKSSAVVDLGTEATLGFTDATNVNMTILPGAKGQGVQVRLSLSRGGKTIVKTRTVKATTGQTKEINLGHGTKLSLTLSPKAAHRIDLPDSDEPLAGLN